MTPALFSKSFPAIDGFSEDIDLGFGPGIGVLEFAVEKDTLVKFAGETGPARDAACET